MLHTPHLSILGGHRVAVSKPDLGLLEGVVADRVLDAMRVASKTLDSLHVRHTLVGGLAVGAHGYPRATKVVDFLVGPEAFEHHAGGLVTMKPGMPIQVAGVAVDFLSIGDDEPHLEQALSEDVASSGALVYLKLKSPRSKDRTDVIEMIKAGLNTSETRAYLRDNAEAFVERFGALVTAARIEEEEEG